MFYHNKCGSYVVIDITGGFRILASIGLSDTKLIANTLDLRSGEGEIPTVFVCPECSNVKLDLTEVHAKCMECGKSLPFSEAYKIRGNGGIFCREHAEMFSASFSSARPIKRLSEIAPSVKVSK